MTRFLGRLLGWLPPVAFVAVLSLPLAQQVFEFAPKIGLGGVTEAGAAVPISFASWHDGDLQTMVEAQIDRSLGLRDWMVRVDNQVRYWLFGVTKRPVVAGPGGWLVEDGYLTSRTHLWGDQGWQILARVHELARAQAVLAEHGVTMLLLITPSKVETLPQHLPLAYRLVDAAQHRRHIDLLRRVLDLGVCNYLDAQKQFEVWREQEPDFPLFSRGGTHWSRVAAARIAVQMLDQLERLSGFDLVNLDLGECKMGSGPGASEDDMAKLANLLDIAPFADPMPIPNVQRRPGDQGKPPGILIVSSSFVWLLAETFRSPQVVSPLTVHYYFKSAFDWIDGRLGEKRPIDFDPAALRAEILRHRFVVVECNESKVPELGFGFPAAVIQAFGEPKANWLPPITAAQLEALKPYTVAGRRP